MSNFSDKSSRKFSDCRLKSVLILTSPSSPSPPPSPIACTSSFSFLFPLLHPPSPDKFAEDASQTILNSLRKERKSNFTFSLLACLLIASHPTCCIMTGTTAWAFFLTSPLRSSKQEYKGATMATKVEGRFFSAGNFSSSHPNTWKKSTQGCQ